MALVSTTFEISDFDSLFVKQFTSITNPGAVWYALQRLPSACLCEICLSLHFLAASGTFQLLESCKLNVPSWLGKSPLPSSFPCPSSSQNSTECIFLACIWLSLTPSIIYLTRGFLFCNHLWFYSKHSTVLVYLEHISNADAVYPHTSLY